MSLLQPAILKCASKLQDPSVHVAPRQTSPLYVNASVCGTPALKRASAVHGPKIGARHEPSSIPGDRLCKMLAHSTNSFTGDHLLFMLAHSTNRYLAIVFVAR